MAKSSKTKIKLPFDKEEESSGRPHYKEGDYPAKVVAVGTGRSKEKDTPFIGVTFKFTEKLKGKKIEERLYITPKSLGRIRNFLTACGVKVKAKKAQEVDLSKVKGKELVISIEDDEYESGGKTRTTSRVSYDGFMSLEDYESGGVEDDSDDDVSDDADESVDSDDSDDDDDSDDVSLDSDDL